MDKIPLSAQSEAKNSLKMANMKRRLLIESLQIAKQGNMELIVMRSVEEMSTEELLRAIDFCTDTGENLGSHAQTDDYVIASLNMAKIYRNELKRRDNSRDAKEINV